MSPEEFSKLRQAFVSKNGRMPNATEMDRMLTGNTAFVETLPERDITRNDLFLKALAIREDYDMAHFGLGLNYATMGMKDKARMEFERTILVTDKEHVKESAKRALEMLDQRGP